MNFHKQSMYIFATARKAARITAVLVSLLSVMLAGAGLQAQDWPEFRGPTGQGHVTDSGSAKALATSWSPSKNVKWKRAIPGQGWSSPVLVGGKIYMTAAVPPAPGAPEFRLVAMCLDAATGKPVWDTAVFKQGGDAPKIHKKNSHASPTPIIEGDRIYVHFGHRGAACLTLKGKIVWKNDSFAYPPVHGNGGSPVLTDKAMIFNCDAGKNPFVLALSKKTGKTIWKKARSTKPARAFSFCTPLLITVAGKQQLISPGSDAVFAYDPANGNEIWRVNYKGGYSVVPRPVFGQGLVFICTGFNKPNLLAIRPDGSGNVTDSHVAWRTGRSAPHTPSLLLVGQELYMMSDGGVASCLDAKTGKEHWTEKVGGKFSASPIFANGKIYYQTEKGLGLIFEAGKTYKEVARNDLKEPTLASYAVGDGAIFIRTGKHLYRIQ
jgi:outer membrane protein assembly factor BamB